MPQRKMSTFINSGNSSNKTVVANNNNNESNCNEMGIDGGNPNSSFSCAYSTAAPSIDDRPPTGPTGKQQFLELPNSMLVNNKATQDHGATDSGRESVNEFDSSLEDTQLSKKPCTADFYTTGRASSSQTKWFVDFKHGNEITAAETVALEEIPATVIALEDVANVGSACNKTAAAVNDEHRSWRIEQSNENLSFSENEGKITTTKNPKIDRINAIGVRSIYSSDYQRLDPVLSNLAHQLRAVSSPSLTEVTQDAALVRTATTVTTSSMLTPSLSPTKAAAAAASSSTSSSSAKTTIILPAADAAYGAIKSSSSHTLHPVAAAQNVGVLQKFKRTFSNFNRNQQQQQQLPSSTTIMLPTPAGFSVTSAEDGGGGGGGGDALQYKANKRSASAGTAAAAAAAESQSADQFAGKCRFGPLIWRSSKERRKAKCNRRDKCNSGDSGIQIELENDEQFAPVVTGQSDAASSGCREPAITSYRSRIRRVNSAKASSNSCSNSGEGKDGRDSGSATASSPLTASLSPPSGHGYKTLEEIDAYDWCVAAPTSLPARSLSQPTGLDRLVVPPHTRTHADPEESDTDSVSSSHQDCNEANDRHRPLFAKVLYNFTSAGPQELSLQRGDLVEILRKEIGPWWYGRKRSDGVIGTTATLFEPQLGWFPKDFVRILLLPELDDFDFPLQQQQQQQHRQQQQRTMASKPSSPALDNTLIAATDSGSEITIAGDSCASRHNNVTTIVIDPASEADSTLVLCHSETQETDTVTVTVTIVPTSPQSPGVLHDNTNIMRNSAVQELYHTEVNYVKLLSAICRGYLPTMSKRIDIFPPDSIRLIFSNIESIFKFQQQFLEALRSGIERNMIAHVFLEHQSGFLVYSTYCNSYPRALIELETYSRNKDARTIMENCRLAEDLPELPLSAHLLAPVQRICRYPLHLAELIKNCCSKSSDEAVAVKDEVDSSLHRAMDTKESLESALKAMKNVTEAVNEGKRHSENLARHQSNFENFSGPPLHFHSTRYFMQIDATRVSPNLWNNTYTLFLFDHQLIYCKKDILKRQHFIYKGRIFLDSCRILNLPDGKIFGATVKNALRIYCDTRNKWFDFSFRSANRKRRFLTTLALERQFCGKNLFISELAASDETTDERDLSDREYHSDYETTVSGRRSRRDNGVGETGPHLVSGGGGGGDVVGETSCSSLDLHCKENVYDVVGGGGSSGGSSSLPESPSKQQHKFCDTLPKHATRHTSHTSTATTVTTNGGGKDLIYDYSTSSLGRRRLGNWFRKSKSTNSTPNQSPTHQPLVLGGAMQLNSDSSSLSSPALGGCKSKELTSSASS